MLRRLRRTEGLDGLLHLYKRLEKRGRALLLCLLCAEAGWLILVNAWLRLAKAAMCERSAKRLVGVAGARRTVFPHSLHPRIELGSTFQFPADRGINKEFRRFK